MPEPLSPKSGLGMNVTVLLYFLATFLMMYLYMHIWSAILTRFWKSQVDLALAGRGHLVVLGLDVHAAVDHRLHHLVADVHQLVGRRHREVAFLVTQLVAQVRVLRRGRGSTRLRCCRCGSSLRWLAGRSGRRRR